MSKSDRNLSEIDLSPIFYEPRDPQFRKDKKIIGLDVETNDGKIFTITKSGPDGDDYLWNIDEIDRRKLLPFITTISMQTSINVFYNMSFDAEAILRNILSDEQLERTALLNECVFVENYKVLYIPGKFFSISQGHSTDEGFKRECSWDFYDAAQFFYGSLEAASQEWLDLGKLNETIDVKQFDRKKYREDKKNKIIKYCRRDSDLVRRLFNEFSRTAESLDLPAGFPVSTGSLAEGFFRRELNNKIKYPNIKIADMAWNSYHGGRFEVLKRGWIGKTETYDINSAYPYQASQLADPYRLNWYKSSDLADFRTGAYGFVKIRVTTSEIPIQPFGIKSDELDKLIFPRLIKEVITVPQQTLVYAVDNDMLDYLEIIDGYTTEPAENAKTPLADIGQLYRKRKEYESQGRKKLGQVIKIVLNSIYGKTAQITKSVKEVKGDYRVAENEEIFPQAFLPNRCTGKFSTLIKEYEAGRWFNPIIASYITGMTRLQLLKFIYDHNLAYDTIMLATDSVMLDKSNRQVDTNEKLGGWSKESEGSTYIIGAGVYEIFPDGRNKKSILKKLKTGELTDYKTKARGFSQYERDDKSLLLDSSKKNGDKTEKLAIRQDRPVSPAEALWGAKDFSSIADFRRSIRKIAPNMDDKRKWANPISFTQLVGGTQTSTYHTYTDGEIYWPDSQLTTKREYIRSRADKIYDKIIDSDGIYITTRSGIYTEWKEGLSYGKRSALRGNSPSLTLDHWADQYGISDDRLIEVLAEATPRADRESQPKEELKHYGKL